jgi:hypothetical protein
MPSNATLSRHIVSENPEAQAMHHEVEQQPKGGAAHSWNLSVDSLQDERAKLAEKLNKWKLEDIYRTMDLLDMPRGSGSKVSQLCNYIVIHELLSVVVLDFPETCPQTYNHHSKSLR